ncbi:FadR family transcriptional regulator [Azospirillum doebereinerae]|uniref:FadR/GntR family transcriptional regulator n=1 Tax=Azospirillum doebereinerae TaxID=92933 RepID=UPI001EE5BDC3|nr:FadR/GntR family transcriptional regulator [Azospirillum doebereinerae]MCG5241528.1 FadR family transcriptional regulator [Azospirillum doebereinerae]
MSLQRRETLTSQLVTALRARIEGGEFPPGAKLPSEHELIESFGVSRTVVREAVATLKAGGLVATRQGVGAFVQAPTAAPPFRIDEADLGVVYEVMSVLELRIGIETEAAALAAQRRKDTHLAAMRDALERIAAAVEAGEDAVSHDLDFHRAIAESTGNRYMLELFQYLGSVLIPRTHVQTFRLASEPREAYLRRINDEHWGLFDAILRQDGDAARAAMRLHLTGSRERLRAYWEAKGGQG